MTNTAKLAVCSKKRTKQSTQREHHVEILNVVVRIETARL
jgi:hypothetical protein